MITQLIILLWREFNWMSGHLLVALFVDACVRDAEHKDTNQASYRKAKLQGMAEDKLRAILGPVEIGGHC
jgi:hypothetical protein